jgi:hypothetical protein
MYPNVLVIPMREDLTRLGIKELRTADEVDEVLADQKGTTLLVINSVCGCAAGNARPAVRLAMLFKDGKLVEMIQRHQIEGRTPEEIAGDLTSAFDTHCN